MFGGLHQSEMAFGHSHLGIALDSADDRQAERLDGFRAQPAVSLAAEPIEHDAGDAHGGVVCGETLGNRGGRS